MILSAHRIRLSLCILALALFVVYCPADEAAGAQDQPATPAPTTPPASTPPAQSAPSQSPQTSPATPKPPAAEPAASAPANSNSSSPAASPPAASPPAASPNNVETPAVVVDGAADTILGKPVVNTAGDDMGRIVDVMVDHAGMVRAAIIDFGGFLGVGTRKIAVDWRALHFPKDGAMDKIVTELSQDQLRVAPAYKPGEPVVIIGRADVMQTPSTSTPPPAAPSSSAPASLAPAPSQPASPSSTNPAPAAPATTQPAPQPVPAPASPTPAPDTGSTPAPNP